MLLAIVSSPFLWRNVAALLLVVVNCALAVRLLAWPAGYAPRKMMWFGVGCRLTLDGSTGILLQ